MFDTVLENIKFKEVLKNDIKNENHFTFSLKAISMNFITIFIHNWKKVEFTIS